MVFSGWSLENSSLTIPRNRLPMLVETFLPKGGLYQVVFRLRYLLAVLDDVGFGVY